MQMIEVEASGLNQLRASLSQAGLPYDDVSDPGRQFYRFDVDGEMVAYGGLRVLVPIYYCDLWSFARSIVEQDWARRCCRNWNNTRSPEAQTDCIC